MGIGSRHNPTAQLAATGQPRVRDAVGRVLEIGDEVLLLTNKMVVRVAEIRPALDPGAPPNTMLMTLVTRVQMASMRDAGIEDLFLLRHQAEIGDKLFPEAQPDPPVEPTNSVTLE